MKVKDLKVGDLLLQVNRQTIEIVFSVIDDIDDDRYCTVDFMNSECQHCEYYFFKESYLLKSINREFICSSKI